MRLKIQSASLLLLGILFVSGCAFNEQMELSSFDKARCHFWWYQDKHPEKAC